MGALEDGERGAVEVRTSVTLVAWQRGEDFNETHRYEVSGEGGGVPSGDGVQGWIELGECEGEEGLVGGVGGGDEAGGGPEEVERPGLACRAWWIL